MEEEGTKTIMDNQKDGKENKVKKGGGRGKPPTYLSSQRLAEKSRWIAWSSTSPALVVMVLVLVLSVLVSAPAPVPVPVPVPVPAPVPVPILAVVVVPAPSPRR